MKKYITSILLIFITSICYSQTEYNTTFNTNLVLKSVNSLYNSNNDFIAIIDTDGEIKKAPITQLSPTYSFLTQNTQFLDRFTFQNSAGGSQQLTVNARPSLTKWGSSGYRIYTGIASLVDFKDQINGAFSMDLSVQPENTSTLTLANIQERSARGDHSFLTQIGNSADSFGEVSLGIYSSKYTIGSATSWIASDRIFNIGNGTSELARSDALTILKSGAITAPSLDLNEITDSKSLITKEYFDANASTATGSNGITSDLKLGSVLDQNTNIGLDSNTFKLTSGSSFGSLSYLEVSPTSFITNNPAVGSTINMYARSLLLSTNELLVITSDNFNIISDATSTRFTDTSTVKKGFVYGDDYSADYTDRSMVDKAYVDNSISSINVPVKTVILEIPDTPDTPGTTNYTVTHNLNITSYVSVDILLVQTFPLDAFGAEDYKVGAAERTQESAGFMTLNSNSLEMGGYDFSSTPLEKLIITYIE